jgi:hypothetical protein
VRIDERTALEPMSRRQHGHQLVLEQRDLAHAPLFRRRADDRDIDAALEERLQRPPRGLGEYAHLHPWVARPELAHQRGQPVIAGVALGGHAHEPGAVGREAPDLVFRVAQRLQHRGRGAEQPLACRSQQHPSARAQEELRAQGLLERPELPAEGGLRQVELGRRATEAARGRDRLHELQVADVQDHDE